jgi:hypothetical protein
METGRYAWEPLALGLRLASNQAARPGAGERAGRYVIFRGAAPIVLTSLTPDAGD